MINDAPRIFRLGNTTVTWSVNDTSGNSATATQTIIIQDTTPPTLTAPLDITQEAESSNNTMVSIETANATDLVGIDKITHDAPDSFPLGLTTITWTATDTSGNSATATQTIIIQDTTPPTLTAPLDITQEAESSNNTMVSIETANATDLVGIDKITHDAPDSFPLGSTIITWTATDTSGNSATATQTIIIQDTTPPKLIAPKSVNAEALDLRTNFIDYGSASTSDLFDIHSITNDAPDSFPLGLTTITWTATDTSGNSATATQTIIIQDTTPPILTAPLDITQEAESSNNTMVSIGTANATDLVGIDKITHDAPDSFPLGSTIITWTATDTSGNSATATQTIIIQDTTPPILTAPLDITQEAESSNNTMVSIGTANATDLVGIDKITHDAPDSFPLGSTIITWTATDTSGNSATATQTIIIQDTTPPILTAPLDITQEAESSNNTMVSIGTANATDLVGIDKITHDAPDSFPLGSTIITWTATDTSGNSATATQTIIIQDTTPPTLTAPLDITQEAESSNNTMVSIETANATDLVGIDKITHDAPDSFPLGLTTITWTATDTSGNSATATQRVIIQDTTPPVIILPKDITINATNIISKINIGNASVFDLIDSAPTVRNNSTGIFQFDQTSISWYSVDKFGNEITSIQNINVQTCGRQVSDFNLIQGTDNDDILIGTSFDDLIIGFGGNDIVTGGSGDDCIFGGSGNDVLLGNSGDDWIITGIGDNIVHADSGNDIIHYDVDLNLISGGLGLDSCIPIHSAANTLLTDCE